MVRLVQKRDSEQQVERDEGQKVEDTGENSWWISLFIT